VRVVNDLDAGRLERVLAQIEDPEDREWLAQEVLPPWRARQRRLARRDELVRALAVLQLADNLVSGRQMAAALARALARYAAAGWRFERDRPAPADPRRALLWRILATNQGKAMSKGAVRRALAGSQSGRRWATGGCIAPGHQQIDDDREGADGGIPITHGESTPQAR
jgi:hypothetical protein